MWITSCHGRLWWTMSSGTSCRWILPWIPWRAIGCRGGICILSGLPAISFWCMSWFIRSRSCINFLRGVTVITCIRFGQGKSCTGREIRGNTFSMCCRRICSRFMIRREEQGYEVWDYSNLWWLLHNSIATNGIMREEYKAMYLLNNVSNTFIICKINLTRWFMEIWL